MTDKTTPTKKDFSPNEKTSNNQSTSTNIQNTEINPPGTTITNLNENYPNKTSQNFTFKIIKRRAPWNKKEDEAIIELVKKYGTSNWTIIANEMALMYKSKHRNGKQCRERWHNHLDPIVNKDNWTEEEENILFSKHLEYGNKWSDISKYLPGRTDNSIKNHFYSKLRKFIRKILKQINKENLLKNNGIDYYKYNSDKVYKLLKKYKITYKNVTKDTILELIIATEKNQKGKIFGLNDENKVMNDNNVNIGNNNKSNLITNNPFNLDNNLIKNSNEKMSRNNSGNKLNNKSIITKKSKIKSRLKSNENINGNNEALFKKEKKIFQSSIVTEFKPIKDDLNENSNINYGANQMNAEVAKSVGKYKKKIKNLQIETDKNFSNNENIINENNNNNDSNTKKKLTINPDYVQETYKFKNKSKSRIKDKENTGNDNKKLLNKKRRRKKRRKVTISLSTPENKKTQISRMMPKRKYFFGIPVENRHRKKNSRKNKLCPEDFNPIINNVEIVREGLEIHSKSIILINKSLLTEKLFPENNYQYKPNLNLTIPVSPRVQQFPSVIPKTMKNGEENNYFHNFNERNISIGLPTPMDGFYEPQLSPVAITNLMMYGPPSTQNIYKLDFRYENSFLRNNLQNSYTPKGYINPSILTPNTPKREINLQNKIVIQNNSNISCNDNTDGNYLQEKCKKPAELNMEFIENYNNENSNNPYPTYPIFGGNDNIGSSLAKQTMNSPANIFNLSPTSPFMPKPPYGDKAL
jgi:hypothetical protein